MPSRSPTAHFLGLELATDQLRAAVVDEQLDLVGVECVDFDSELVEFQCVPLVLLRVLTGVLRAHLQNTWRHLHVTRGGVHNAS